MRAFSSKKYSEPVVVGDSLILTSVDGTTEVRVREAIKYIGPDNKTKVFKPEVDRKLRVESN